MAKHQAWQTVALAPDWQAQYALLDSGHGLKLERFGPPNSGQILIRPEPQALWAPAEPIVQWQRQAHAEFQPQGSHAGQWQHFRPVQDPWELTYPGPGYDLQFKLALTRFKHVGVFPEQAANWDYIHARSLALRQPDGQPPRVLNLFAYTGGATLAARAAGAQVTHVDAIKQVVSWANDNLQRNNWDGVRWLVEDALKFVKREVRRGARYEGLILDPPAFGHGPNGERWKLEDMLWELLEPAAELLSGPDAFLVLNVYSLGLSPLVTGSVLRALLPQPQAQRLTVGELYVPEAARGLALPGGTYARC